MGFGGYTGKGQRFAVEVLSADEVRMLMKACSRRGACGVRDRAMIAVMFRCGLRLAEALALTPNDVALESGAVNVRCGKGGKQRFVGADPETIALVGHWLDVRSRWSVRSDSPLFCTLEGAALWPENVRKKLKVLAARAGISKRVHPHGLRHSFAAELAGEKVDLRVIQNALGHSNVAVTNTYISHLPAGAVIDTMKARTW